MEELFNKARSIESKDNDLNITPAGTVQKGNRFFDFFRDEAGNVWYSTRIRTEEGVKSEEEVIFGRMIRRRK